MLSIKVKIDRNDNKEVFSALLDYGIIIRAYREQYSNIFRHYTSTFWLDFETEEEMFNTLTACNTACREHGIAILKRKEKNNE